MISAGCTVRAGLTRLLAFLLLTGASTVWAQQRPAPPPAVLSESAILLDYTTGKVLYEKNADEERAPASLTKLFTLHLVYEKIREGVIRPDDPVEITPEAWAARMPGSSLMFLEPGQRVTVAELMKGLAVCSGNDAALALARHASGSVAAFVAEMNAEARRLGFSRMRFVDPSGLSSRNRITAREFARFCVQYVRLHPQSLKELHSVPEMSYPLPRNMPLGRPSHTNTIHQYNRNELLELYDGVDGLKTGFIRESGYNYALTAREGNRRLVVVSLGGQGRTALEGRQTRTHDGLALLRLGFQEFVNVSPRVAGLAPVRVWKGRQRELPVEADRTPTYTVPRGQLGSLGQTVRLPASVTAPVSRGERIGEVVFSAGGKEIGRVALLAAADVPQAGLLTSLRDSVLLFFKSRFDPEKPTICHSPVQYLPGAF